MGWFQPTPTLSGRFRWQETRGLAKPAPPMTQSVELPPAGPSWGGGAIARRSELNQLQKCTLNQYLYMPQADDRPIHYRPRMPGCGSAALP